MLWHVVLYWCFPILLTICVISRYSTTLRLVLLLVLWPQECLIVQDCGCWTICSMKTFFFKQLLTFFVKLKKRRVLRHLTRLVRFKQILTLVCLGLCESCCGFYDAFKSKNTITSTRAIRQSEAVTAVCWAGILLVCCGSSLSLWHGHPTVMCTNDSLFIPLGVVIYSWEVLKKSDLMMWKAKAISSLVVSIILSYFGWYDGEPCRNPAVCHYSYHVC